MTSMIARWGRPHDRLDTCGGEGDVKKAAEPSIMFADLHPPRPRTGKGVNYEGEHVC